MGALEVAVGDAVVQLDRGRVGRLFGKKLVIFECWHKAQVCEEGAEGDDSLLVHVGKRIVELRWLHQVLVSDMHSPALQHDVCSFARAARGPRGGFCCVERGSDIPSLPIVVADGE